MVHSKNANLFGNDDFIIIFLNQNPMTGHNEWQATFWTRKEKISPRLCGLEPLLSSLGAPSANLQPSLR